MRVVKGVTSGLPSRNRGFRLSQPAPVFRFHSAIIFWHENKAEPVEYVVLAQIDGQRIANPLSLARYQKTTPVLECIQQTLIKSNFFIRTVAKATRHRDDGLNVAWHSVEFRMVTANTKNQTCNFEIKFHPVVLWVSSSNWQNGGFQIRQLEVRVLPGPPIYGQMLICVRDNLRLHRDGP